MKQNLTEMAMAAKEKNTHVRNALEQVLRELEKIDAGQKVYIDLKVDNPDQYDGTLWLCTGSYDLYTDCSLFAGMEPWSATAYPWSGLPIAVVKKVLGALPEALEGLTKELEKIAGYEIPEKLRPFLTEQTKPPGQPGIKGETKMESTTPECRCPNCNHTYSWSVTDHEHEDGCECETAEPRCSFCDRTPDELE